MNFLQRVIDKVKALLEEEALLCCITFFYGLGISLLCTGLFFSLPLAWVGIGLQLFSGLLMMLKRDQLFD